MRTHSNWQWHHEEVFVKINGVMHQLWRTLGNEGEGLESCVTKQRHLVAINTFNENRHK